MHVILFMQIQDIFGIRLYLRFKKYKKIRCKMKFEKALRRLSINTSFVVAVKKIKK